MYHRHASVGCDLADVAAIRSASDRWCRFLLLYRREHWYSANSELELNARSGPGTNTAQPQYVLETYLTRAMDTQAIFVFFKCIWGFAVSYFAIVSRPLSTRYKTNLRSSLTRQQFEEETSLITEYAVEGALATGMGALICGIFIWKGEAIRRAQGMPTINPTAAKRIA